MSASENPSVEQLEVEPDLSLIMPCYNEEESIGYTIPRLLNAFQYAGIRLELVAVDNGSLDGTRALIADLAAKHPEIVPCKVEKNIGFGQGILAGIPACTGPWIGMVAADGQVDAEDVVRLYEAAASTNGKVFAKVRRRFRMDGFLRKLVSIGYNAFVLMLWPRIGSVDINGNPRMLPRDVIEAMALESTDWLLDPEMLIKAYYLNVRVLELNVFARMRGSGLSHVRASTCWAFFWQLLEFRFTGRLAAWRSQLGAGSGASRSAPV
jgi:glycosyltransferase involved in cell wall biosynthesis